MNADISLIIMMMNFLCHLTFTFFFCVQCRILYGRYIYVRNYSVKFVYFGSWFFLRRRLRFLWITTLQLKYHRNGSKLKIVVSNCRCNFDLTIFFIFFIHFNAMSFCLGAMALPSYGWAGAVHVGMTVIWMLLLSTIFKTIWHVFHLSVTVCCSTPIISKEGDGQSKRYRGFSGY